MENCILTCNKTVEITIHYCTIQRLFVHQALRGEKGGESGVQEVLWYNNVKFDG